MKSFLWSISELVADPAPQILNTVHQHILEKIQPINGKPDENYDCCNEIAKQSKIKKEKPIEIKDNNKNYHDVVTQTEIKQIEASVQSLLYHSCTTDTKSTNTHNNISRDKGIETNNKNYVFKSTNTEKDHLCTQHDQIFLYLQNWPPDVCETSIKRSSKYLSCIKNLLDNFMNYFNVESIQNISDYEPQRVTTKLYRDASYGHIHR